MTNRNDVGFKSVFLIQMSYGDKFTNCPTYIQAKDWEEAEEIYRIYDDGCFSPITITKFQLITKKEGEKK